LCRRGTSDNLVRWVLYVLYFAAVGNCEEVFFGEGGGAAGVGVIQNAWKCTAVDVNA
jgi:hypothetical protein